MLAIRKKLEDDNSIKNFGIIYNAMIFFYKHLLKWIFWTATIFCNKKIIIVKIHFQNC